jgi:hypothetical protein
MMLTEAERQKFSEWLKRDAESNRLLAEQLEKMHPPLAKQKRTEAAAELIVARILDTSEGVDIDG